jgi:hypothetical protein
VGIQQIDKQATWPMRSARRGDAPVRYVLIELLRIDA